LAVSLGLGPITEEQILKISTVERLNEETLSSIYLKTIKFATTSGMFGEVSFYTRGIRDHWAVCNMNFELLKLSRSKFDELQAVYGSEIEK
jgi:hypothetical protein